MRSGARVPNYTAVPCPVRRCISNPGQTCPTGTSHRERIKLWEAVAQAQERGETGVWWNGRFIQVQTRLR